MITKHQFDQGLNGHSQSTAARALTLPRVQDDKSRICPTAALDKVLRRLGAASQFAFADEETRLALARLGEDMVERALDFGAHMSRQRDSLWFEVRPPPACVWLTPTTRHANRHVCSPACVHTRSRVLQQRHGVAEQRAMCAGDRHCGVSCRLKALR